MAVEAGAQREQTRNAAATDQAAFVGQEDPGERLEQRRLAGAVATHDADDLAAAEPERDLAARVCGLPADRGRVVGMGIEPFTPDPAAFD
jgi:hypothetical protein